MAETNKGFSRRISTENILMDYRFIIEKWLLGQHNGYRSKQQYEREVQKAIGKIHGRLFVDIGARELFYSNRFAKNFDQVIAFEPNRNITNLRPKPNVLVSRQALSDTVGTAMFYCQNNGGADGLIKDFDYDVPDRGCSPGQKGPLGPTMDSFQVETSTYDQAIGRTAELVKIDVEGAEFLVLKGADASLSAKKIENIVIELHDRKRMRELEDILTRYDYKLRWLDGDHIFASLKKSSKRQDPSSNS
jgi:FkbM family methyltransferase